MALEGDLFGIDSDGLSQAQLTQQLLRGSRERLDTVLKAMPVGLLIHSAQGILYSNPAAAALLQNDVRQLCGQHFLDFVRSEQTHELCLSLTEVLNGRRDLIDCECVLEPAGRQTRICHVIIGRLPWPV